MIEVLKLFIGIFVLALGFPLGNLIASMTREELKSGQRYFKIIVLLGLIGGVVGLILKNDAFLFTMLFIAVVTSRSLNNKKNKNVKN